MLRVCLYARFSTEKQTESSIDDQLRVCRARIEREGWQEVACHYDMAVSGSTSVASRPGGCDMLDAAMNNQFDILIMEGLDRLSRDLVEQERIVRRLEHRGIRIIGLSDGYDSRMAARKVLRGVRGLINELYLDDLRSKTHRGQTGQIERGYIAGGKSYGYNIVKHQRGSLYEINDEQAKWVRWIFKEYSEGASVQKIAHELNRLAIESPRNGTWAVSAIYGSPLKGSGILNNQLYVGRLIWNRSQWIKNPDTGTRQRIDRPKDEWKIIDLPDLRIVDQDIWDKVRTRLDHGRDSTGRKRPGKARVSLFGGLMRCPYCKGAMIAVNTRSYGCNAAKDKGRAVCKGFLVRRDLVEGRLLAVLRDDLLSEQAADKFQKYFREAVYKLAQLNKKEINHFSDRLTEIEIEIQRLLDAIVKVGISDNLAARLKKLEAQQKSIVEHINTQRNEMNIQLPNMKLLFKEALLRLNDVLDTNPEKARPILNSIFSQVDFFINEKNEVYAQVETAQALNYAVEPFLKLVAGARYDLYRQSLVVSQSVVKDVYIKNINKIK